MKLLATRSLNFPRQHRDQQVLLAPPLASPNRCFPPRQASSQGASCGTGVLITPVGMQGVEGVRQEHLLEQPSPSWEKWTPYKVSIKKKVHISTYQMELRTVQDIGWAQVFASGSNYTWGSLEFKVKWNQFGICVNFPKEKLLRDHNKKGSLVLFYTGGGHYLERDGQTMDF